MKPENKFSTGRHQEQAAESQTAESLAAHTAAQEFQNVEDLLRHDAAQTPVPPEIARRLSESIAQPAPRRSWWRKLLG
jgi:hypothetical protein